MSGSKDQAFICPTRARRRRESARRAPVGERRHRGPAQRTAEQHGQDGAVAQPWLVGMSGTFGNAGTAGGVSRSPDLTPIDVALVTRATPAPVPAPAGRCPSPRPAGVRMGEAPPYS